MVRFWMYLEGRAQGLLTVEHSMREGRSRGSLGFALGAPGKFPLSEMGKWEKRKFGCGGEDKACVGTFTFEVLPALPEDMLGRQLSVRVCSSGARQTQGTPVRERCSTLVSFKAMKPAIRRLQRKEQQGRVLAGLPVGRLPQRRPSRWPVGQESRGHPVSNGLRKKQELGPHGCCDGNSVQGRGR